VVGVRGAGVAAAAVHLADQHVRRGRSGRATAGDQRGTGGRYDAEQRGCAAGREHVHRHLLWGLGAPRVLWGWALRANPAVVPRCSAAVRRAPRSSPFGYLVEATSSPRNSWYVVTACDVDRTERRRMKR